MRLDAYEQNLLNGWEEVFKKGQLTLWIMLALDDGPKHMTEIKDFISSATQQALTADDQSMYRSLRRYNSAEIIDFNSKPGNNGPDLKIYRLTKLGKKLLQEFLERNIKPITRQSSTKRSFS